LSWLELLLIPLGFAVGAYGTLVGTGGGFVLVPVLLLIYPDEPPASITAISLAVIFVNAASGSAAYARLRRIDYRTGAIFVAAALPGAVAGAFLVHQLPRASFEVIFGLVLLGLGGFTMWNAGRTAFVRMPPAGRGIVTRIMPADEEGQMYRYSFNVYQGTAVSIGVGLISTLLGIGGGVLQVPVMITLLHFPVHVATATSQFVLMFVAGAGSGVHLSQSELVGSNALRALLLAAGVIPGAQVGARIAQRLRDPVITRLLVIALVIVGARLLWSGLAG
jgi:uncharacterized protein